ncbi:MAG TPA: POTRA domain-containing protein [Longimicrobium sp.]|nr:POTRA domain-containing protein [Longimicrobium sp.]
MIRIALAAVSLALVADAASAQARVEVADVELEGVRALDERLVRAALATRETRCRSQLAAPACALGADWAQVKAYLDSAEVRRDEARIDSLYDRWGYPDAVARGEIRDVGSGEVVVTFRVEEGRPLLVRSLQVRGLEPFADSIDLPDLPLREGEPYAIPLLEASQRAIVRALAELGYAFAAVEVSGNVAREAGTADVVLEAVPGPVAVFGPTAILAEAPLKERDVRERLAYREGDRFSPSALERTAERLYRLPIVENATLRPVADATGQPVIEPRVDVTATKPAGWQVEGIVSGSSCLGGETWWASRYFLGAPRVFSVRVGASNLFAKQLNGFPCTSADEDDEFSDPNYFVRTELREPIGPLTWLMLDAQASRESATRAYVRRGVSGRVGVSTLLARGLDALAAYAPERSDNEGGAPFFCALYGVCGGERLDELTGTSTLAPAQLSLAYTPPSARRPAFGPRSSWDPLRPAPDWLLSTRLTVDAAGGATGSEYDFARGVLEGNVTRLVGGRVELAARGRAGLLAGAGDPLPPQLRLFGGGPRGTRGVPQNLLGPRILVVRDTTAGDLGCEIAPGACEGADIDPEDVFQRATGGDALVEASVEARVWVTNGLQVAAFADFGAVSSGADDGAPAAVQRSESVFTPGIGVLAITPAGPVRIDVAYNPSPARRYPLLSRDPDGDDYIYLGDVRYDPFGREGGSQFWRRLQLQLTVGQVF